MSSRYVATSVMPSLQNEDARLVEMVARDKEDVRAEEIARQVFRQEEKVPRQHLSE